MYPVISNTKELEQNHLPKPASVIEHMVNYNFAKDLCESAEIHAQAQWNKMLQESDKNATEKAFEIEEVQQIEEQCVPKESDGLNESDSHLVIQELKDIEPFKHEQKLEANIQSKSYSSKNNSISLENLQHKAISKEPLPFMGLEKQKDCAQNVNSVATVIQNSLSPEMFTEEHHLILKTATKSTNDRSSLHCTHCGRVFVDNRCLQRHILVHMGIRPHKCDICSKSFMLNGDLTRHLRIHSGERPFGCDICGRRFTLKGNLMQHFRTHNPEKQFICTICHKNYAQKDSLHRHIRAHFGEKPFECSTCSKRFTLKGDLSRHILIHTGLKPHSCKVCGRKFALKGNLAQHMRIHTKERSNKTPSIHFVKSFQNQFITNSVTYQEDKVPETNNVSISDNGASNIDHHNENQTDHTQSQVSNSLPIHVFSHSDMLSDTKEPASSLSFCSECSKMFPSLEKLRNHVQQMHEVNSHTDNNKYVCNICEKVFFLKGDLNRHLNSHNGIKPYSCSNCGKMFTLKSNLHQHLTTHRLEKPFLCPSCGKQFGNQRNLKLHVKRHEHARVNFACTKCGRAFLAKSDHFFHPCARFDNPVLTFSNTARIQDSHVPSPNPTHITLPESQPILRETSGNSNILPIHLPPIDIKHEDSKYSCSSNNNSSSPIYTPVTGSTAHSIVGSVYQHMYCNTTEQCSPHVLQDTENKESDLVPVSQI